MLSVQVLADLGMAPSEPATTPPAPPKHIAVQLDGRLIGHLPAALGDPVMARLHALKAAALSRQEGSPPGALLPSLTVSSSF